MTKSTPSEIGIIVFVKNPRLGYVKTRLAIDIGDQKALEIYMKLTEHTKTVLSELSGVDRYVFYSDYIDDSDGWSSHQFVKGIQHNGDLGDRIKSAFYQVFQSNKKSIIIGSDCAQLTAAHIEKAILSLEQHNVVIGPSLDGGYYLLGMDSNYSFLFESIEWSTDSVFEETQKKALENNLTVGIIETLSDIDYLEDWEKYGKNIIG